tara:strand:- start:5014 stop:5592 length:579 start_codon:yes stop_codon:yes gene_type:complete
MIRPGYARIIAEFEELEPLAAHWRPELIKAVEFCQDHDAFLVFGQLDRMRSGVHWLGFVKECGVRFRGADAPHIDYLTHHQLMYSDEDWRRDLGQKISATLGTLKEHGKQLGGNRGFSDGLTLGPAASVAARRKKADRRDSSIWCHIQLIQHRGVTSFSGIANRLNQMTIPAPRGGKWSAIQVKRVVEKFSS